MGINMSIMQLENINLTSQCMANGAKKHRHFVFTWNNPTAGDQDSGIPGEHFLKAIPGRSYLVAGLERGASGTQHLQGAISFTSPRTLRSVTRLIPGAHIEVQRGTHEQAHTYCKKDGHFFEDGVPTVDPARQAVDQSEQWDFAWESAVSGTLADIPTALRVKYYRTWTLVHRDHQVRPPSLETTCGVWIYGPSGTGKSHFISSTYPNSFIKDASKWWCGYNGEEVIWLDDVDPEQSKWLARFLKIWADRYPFQAQTKGGSIIIRPKRFIVTSNYSIDEMGFGRGDLEPIKRRFLVLEKKNRDSEINLI